MKIDISLFSYYTTGMVLIILYIFAIFAELFFFIAFSIFILSLIYSSIKGSPYVPTRNHEVDEILRQIKLKPEMKFYELGSGDARVSRRAAKNFAINAVAVDINPLLTLYARLLAKIQKIKTVKFITGNIFETDINHADVVYLFLMPKLLSQLEAKFKKELKPGTIVISHGFKIEGFKKNLFKTVAHSPFPTYYYRVI